MGLNVLEPSTQADPQSSPALNNMVVLKGIPQKRLGFWQLGGSLSGNVIGVFEFESLSGARTLLAITTTKRYKLDTGSDPAIWTEITGSTAWTGTVADFLDVAIVVGINSSLKKYVVISNGKDKAQFWDGSGNFADYVANLTGYVTHRTMKQFFNSIVTANLTLASSNPQLIAWSVLQQLLDFTGTGSGEIIAPGITGSFVRAEILGDRLALYSEDSICLMTYVGGDQIFSLEIVAQQTRLVSGRTIVNLGPFHVFLSQENAFLFDGSRLVRSLGDKIYRLYRKELAVSRASEAFAYHDAARQQVYFTVPIGATDHAIYVLDYDLYNIAASKWTRQQYSIKPEAMGSWSRVSTLTFDSYWAQHTNANIATFPADSGTTRNGFPVRVLGMSTKVYVADETVSVDDATAVNSYLDTVDFAVPGGFLSELSRWLEIEFEASGSSVDVYYSVDGGSNYTLAGTVTLNSNWGKYRLPIDALGSTFRVRYQHTTTAGTFAVHPWTRAWYRPGGPS